MITYTLRVAYALLRGARTHAGCEKGGVFSSPFSKKHVSKFWAHPFDVDIQMHVNNARYLQIAELTRWQALTADGLLGEALKNKWMFLARACNITYHAPIPPMKRYICTAEATHDSKKWITFKHRFECPKTGKLYAEAEVLAVIKLSSGKTVSPLEYEHAAEKVHAGISHASNHAQ